MKPIKTRGGRVLNAAGDASLLTIERMNVIGDRFDAEPRLASVSLVPAPVPSVDGTFLRATGPAGAVVVTADDLTDLLCSSAEQDLVAWSTSASERGLWHDWLFVSQPDVLRAEATIASTDTDLLERDDSSGSHYAVLVGSLPVPAALTVTIDATWLGPHETGAQVLTTAAIAALARTSGIEQITLTGIDELPEYAQHLADLDRVRIASSNEQGASCADIVWYPNQIDQRSNIKAARRLGERVVTTYLDLIAYDIPRYHGSMRDWHTYRALQRTIALSVDGITTISTDVAQRLIQEVPRLQLERVQPIPLGLDHIRTHVPTPGADIAELVRSLNGKPFVVVLGNDFVHKNRDFAIAVWERVLAAGVNCDLVLAGLHVRSSSSRDTESALLAAHTNLRGSAHTVGHVISQSREWLLANAGAVIYPSSAEGFGFVPYEAAVLGTPATFTAFGPLSEISGITSVPHGWSVDAYAADVIALLTDDAAAHRRVQELHDAISRHTWDGFAEELTDFFRRIRSLPTFSPTAGATDEDVAAMVDGLATRGRKVARKVKQLGSYLRRR